MTLGLDPAFAARSWQLSLAGRALPEPGPVYSRALDVGDAVAMERRRDFARKYVVERAVGVLLTTSIDLSTVTADSSIAQLGLGTSFIERIGEEFGWVDIIPNVDTLGDLADFFAIHYAVDSRMGRRMHAYGASAIPA